MTWKTLHLSFSALSHIGLGGVAFLAFEYPDLRSGVQLLPIARHGGADQQLQDEVEGGQSKK